ncbi:hypothetical protein [Caldibacillus debilis]|uniref:Uncharacterized protein n=1 Tax=Caldibacillus debilis GB1 TaxID=1339248 RepID=A0A420VE67_9BACI|nr:hypothetical protein [Caldibacillus debilis]RKO61643.1 hypothetical protein Cdeb_01114 [Caldibacillus debilis GB1]
MEKCKKCKKQTFDFDTMETKCSMNMEQFNKAEEEDCPHYKSKFIEFPLTIQGIQNHFTKDGMGSLYECGKLVKIKPCGEKYENKTYLGILLGDLPIGAFVSFHHDDQKLHITPHSNPAIFVPELKKIIYGYESWWGEIESLEDFKEITTEDIENVWYVKLLKAMIPEEDKQSNGN